MGGKKRAAFRQTLNATGEEGQREASPGLELEVAELVRDHDHERFACGVHVDTPLAVGLELVADDVEEDERALLGREAGVCGEVCRPLLLQALVRGFVQHARDRQIVVALVSLERGRGTLAPAVVGHEALLVGVAEQPQQRHHATVLLLFLGHEVPSFRCGIPSDHLVKTALVVFTLTKSIVFVNIIYQKRPNFRSFLIFLLFFTSTLLLSTPQIKDVDLMDEI